jgi:hypothetical protein
VPGVDDLGTLADLDLAKSTTTPFDMVVLNHMSRDPRPDLDGLTR